MSAVLTSRTFPALPGVTCGAKFDADRSHRYALWRLWDHALPPLVWIGMNPSAAAEDRDDASVRKLLRYAQAHGYGSLWVFNAYAYCATNPDEMRRAPDAVGADNDAAILFSLEAFGDALPVPPTVLAGWGCIDKARDTQLRDLLGGLWIGRRITLVCLALTKEGFPKHPLYAKMDALLAFDPSV